MPENDGISNHFAKPQVEVGISLPYRVSGQPHGNKVKTLRKPCYPAGRKLSLEFILCYFAYGYDYYTIRNLSMIAYVIETQKSKFSNT